MQKPRTLEKVLATRLNEDAQWALKRASLHRSKSARLFGDEISAYDPFRTLELRENPPGKIYIADVDLQPERGAS